MAQFSPALLDARLDVAVEADADFGIARARTGPAPSRADIRLSLYEDLAAIEREWRDFETRADGTVFQTYAWLSTWQRHIGARRGVQPAVVIARNARGEIVLLAPLAIERHAWSQRLTWLGGALCDYNAPLLARDFSQHVSRTDFASCGARHARCCAAIRGSASISST